MSKSPLPGQSHSFEACLENWAEGMDYCAVRVPPEITQALGTIGPVLVMAQVNGSEPFKVSLFPVGGGQHYIRIKASVRKQANTKTGDDIRLRFVVLDRSDIKVPEDLMNMLAAEGVVESFMALAPGKRHFIVRRIEEAVKPATRDKRIREGVVAAHQRRDKMNDQN